MHTQSHTHTHRVPEGVREKEVCFHLPHSSPLGQLVEVEMNEGKYKSCDKELEEYLSHSCVKGVYESQVSLQVCMCVCVCMYISMCVCVYVCVSQPVPLLCHDGVSDSGLSAMCLCMCLYACQCDECVRSLPFMCEWICVWWDE